MFEIRPMQMQIVLKTLHKIICTNFKSNSLHLSQKSCKIKKKSIRKKLTQFNLKY